MLHIVYIYTLSCFQHRECTVNVASECINFYHEIDLQMSDCIGQVLVYVQFFAFCEVAK